MIPTPQSDPVLITTFIHRMYLGYIHRISSGFPAETEYHREVMRHFAQWGERRWVPHSARYCYYWANTHEQYWQWIISKYSIHRTIPEILRDYIHVRKGKLPWSDTDL